MKIRTVNSDGTAAADREFEFAPVSSDGAPYDPPVTIHYRLISPAARQAMTRQATKPQRDKATRGMTMVRDDDALANLLIQAAVVDWTGINGDDDHPLVCTDETKVYLPDHLKVQVMEVALTTEAADATAESFREPADVVRVVGGRGAH